MTCNELLIIRFLIARYMYILPDPNLINFGLIYILNFPGPTSLLHLISARNYLSTIESNDYIIIHLHGVNLRVGK